MLGGGWCNVDRAHVCVWLFNHTSPLRTLAAEQAELPRVGQGHDEWRVAALAGVGHELLRQLTHTQHACVGTTVAGLRLECLQREGCE